MSSESFDRREFLRLGIASTAAAALGPPARPALVHAKGMLTSPPTLAGPGFGSTDLSASRFVQLPRGDE